MPSLFDLHCSTAYQMYKTKQRFKENNLGVDIKKLSVFPRCFQVFSFPAEKDLTDDEAFLRFKHAAAEFNAEIQENKDDVCLCTSAENISRAKQGGKTGVLISVEDARILGKDISRLETLYDLGVRMITLCGKGETVIGGGRESEKGLSDFGFEVLNECERLGILADVSHASEKSFWDVAGRASKPFFVSHSNSAYLCPDCGSISDIQFRTVASCKGIVGISLAYGRLSAGFKEDVGNERGTTDPAMAVEAFCRHIEHFAEIDKNAVCLGLGLDGTEKIPCIEDVTAANVIYQALTNRGLDEKTADRFFFDNAYDFFSRTLI